MSGPVQWDGSLAALHRIEHTMRDCLVWHDPMDGSLVVKTERNPEARVPLNWWVTRAREGAVTLTPERPDSA